MYVKNSNKKMTIKPVSEGQCHCCAKDLKTAHSGGSFKCTNCDMSFKKESSLERYLVVIHWESEACTCKECGSTFADKKALDKHRYTTHMKSSKVYKCNKCDTYFSRSYHLNRHKQQSGCHGDISNRFSCQVAEKIKSEETNLLSTDELLKAITRVLSIYSYRKRNIRVVFLVATA